VANRAQCLDEGLTEPVHGVIGRDCAPER
jgi:hypothetical protein